MNEIRHDKPEYRDPLKHPTLDHDLEVEQQTDLGVEFAELPWAESPPADGPHEELMRAAAKAALAASQRIGWPLPRDDAALREGSLTIAGNVLQVATEQIRAQLAEIEFAIETGARRPLLLERLQRIRSTLDKALGIGTA